MKQSSSSKKGTSAREAFDFNQDDDEAIAAVESSSTSTLGHKRSESLVVEVSGHEAEATDGQNEPEDLEAAPSPQPQPPILGGVQVVEEIIVVKRFSD